MIGEIVKANRSYRRFFEDKPIDAGTLKSLADLGRLSPSAMNLQPLKYLLSVDERLNGRIFPALGWAGYLKDWPGPAEGERPSAYIVILGDREISREFGCDHGIAAQSIMLGAVEKGLVGCMISCIDRKTLRRALDLPERYEILMVLALGYPRERVVLEEVGADGDVRYWRDSERVHHVPKRPLSEVIIELEGTDG